MKILNTSLKKMLAVVLCTVTFMMTSCDEDYRSQSKYPIETFIEDAVTDYDGNHYNAVRIGNQVWMAENLRTTHYANGDGIQLASYGNGIEDAIPLRYEPFNKADSVTIYGYLYTWMAVTHGNSSSANPSGVQGICPNGWHVPSIEEYNQLTTTLKYRDECQCGTNHTNLAKALAYEKYWTSCNTDCTPGKDMEYNNATKFSALPVGTYKQYNGGAESINISATFWTCSSEGSGTLSKTAFSIHYNEPAPITYTNQTWRDGRSVRCVRD